MKQSKVGKITKFGKQGKLWTLAALKQFKKAGKDPFFLPFPCGISNKEKEKTKKLSDTTKGKRENWGKLKKQVGKLQGMNLVLLKNFSNWGRKAKTVGGGLWLVEMVSGYSATYGKFPLIIIQTLSQFCIFFLPFSFGISILF